jgi:hypothetical protein
MPVNGRFRFASGSLAAGKKKPRFEAGLRMIGQQWRGYLSATRATRESRSRSGVLFTRPIFLRQGTLLVLGMARMKQGPDIKRAEMKQVFGGAE